MKEILNKQMHKDKKGGLVLRDVVFMMFLFLGIVAFSSILVTEMGNEYNNDNMTQSYNQDTIGKDALENKSQDWEQIGEDLSGENGVMAMIGGGLAGAGNVLVKAISAPITFSKMLTSTLNIIGVTEEFQNVAGWILAGFLYVLIIFSIIKVFLRGGDI